jgi:hypothetical protein
MSDSQMPPSPTTDVSTLCDVPILEAKHCHQSIKDSCCVLNTEVFVESRARGQSIARQRRNDDMIWQRFGGVFVLEQLEDGQEFEEASCKEYQNLMEILNTLQCEADTSAPGHPWSMIRGIASAFLEKSAAK